VLQPERDNMPIGYGSWSKITSKEVKTEVTAKHGKRTKGRSIKTYQNKINQLKRKYRKLFKSSKKRKTHFYLDYPTEESYMKEIKLKQPNTDK
jgi:hypothetical protein